MVRERGRLAGPNELRAGVHVHTRPQPTIVIAPRRRRAPAPARAGLLCALAAAATCWLPLIGVIAWPCIAFGIVYSADALDRAHRTGAPRGLPRAGLALSLAACAVATAWMFTYITLWTDLPFPGPWS